MLDRTAELGLPEGNILFRWKPQPKDNVTGVDDVPLEYVVIENKEAMGGIVVWGLASRGWVSNFQSRHLVKYLLNIIERIADDNSKCRLDHNGFCQNHGFYPPCVYGEIKEATKESQ